MLKLTFDKPVKHKWKDCFVKIKSWRKFIILDILLFLIMLLWGQSHCVSHLVCCDNFATRHVLPPTTFGLKTFRFVINYVPALCLMLFYIDNVLNKQFLKSSLVLLCNQTAGIVLQKWKSKKPTMTNNPPLPTNRGSFWPLHYA